ncbi:hypothetical protein [Mesorhizobium sp. B2-5-3]|uniref:hypothetical protein n=1 Tax=Mesorhizobium sp. B2-5-3 TaxID=2589927 RepID=UPI001FEF3A77|nr:hypothetical protein [Mesorhizobium sp. B2-5-3]
MAQDIGQKLRVTMAFLGAVTRKDLAAAFRRVNPATSFDVERAHKWMQGRAHPRELRLYEDWAKVVDVGRPGAWIADCELDEFIQAICTRHNCERDTLERISEPSRRSLAGQRQDASRSLAGTYACYSHAWSPYFRAQFIRAELSIQSNGPQGVLAQYSERLPTSRFQLEGPLVMAGRAMHLDLVEPSGDGRMFFCLSLPTPPASVLAGLMCGATIIGPDAQPSVTRIVMIRLPAPSMRLRSAVAYLPSQTSIAGDLASLGLRIPDPAAVDDGVGAFLTGGHEAGLDQVQSPCHRALVDLFDPIWLAGAMAQQRFGEA